MPEDTKHVALEPSQLDLDRPETTVNVVGPDTWDSATPRRLDPDQSPAHDHDWMRTTSMPSRHGLVPERCECGATREARRGDGA